MSTLGLVQTTPHLDTTLVSSTTDIQLRIQDALASPGRLWLRGRILDRESTRVPERNGRPWWQLWSRQHDAPAPPELAQLESHISGKVFQANVPLTPDGRFEAMWVTDLPPARRGWRVARNHLTYGGRSQEACALVLTPPAKTSGVVAVVLPSSMTQTADGPQRLASSKLAARLSPLFRQLHRSSSGTRAIYYVACVPPGGEGHQAELALAAASLGWPSQPFVLLPTEPDQATAAFAQAVDRLRWLFAGSLDLSVLNLDPEAVTTLNQSLHPTVDRAEVQQLIHPEEDPWVILGAATRPQKAVIVNGLRPSRAGRVTKYPVVFLHGMLGYSLIRMQIPEDCNCFSPLGQFFRERGFRVLFPQVHPTGSVIARAQELRDQIRRWTNEPVNLIAHSMGGLDARHLVTHLGMADRVRSLTAVCTPHRGSYLADWFLTHYRNRFPLLLAMEALGVNVDGFRDCTPEACRRFNAVTPDMPGVRYFSYGGDVPQSRVSPALRRAWSLLTSTEGPNDGMVSIQSAHWGEYLGTLHADHFAQTPDGMYVRAGEDFDALGFYSRLVEDLARRGF